MKYFPLLCASLIISLYCVGLHAEPAQKSKTAATHFYTVNFDQKLLDIFASAKTGKTSPSSSSVNNESVAGIIDTFYTIASEKFKNDLDLELLPINELQGKVKYNKQCPDCPNIKKVLKSASGYKYYVDYYVNIFSNTDPLSMDTINTSSDIITPMYAISFTIYDNTGRQFEKIQFLYKSENPLTRSKQDLDNIRIQMKSKLCNLYSEALKGLTIECKKLLPNKHSI